ncbi:unnamed protein product [Mytilus coruscus]|uniref:SMP-30/Gluconolactonase/LRE-like region domain-containing protein n=1 Tax=Mytilus coruscus TaxID=42192 RepID=A0A6J8CZN2_MYTCO|nr:unnamed protein product [Mytilus coruscus]
MKELDKIEEECCKKIESIVSSLNNQIKEIIHCNQEIESMKKYASDIQVFLGKREILKNIAKNEHCIQSIVQKRNVDTVGLDCSIDAKIQDFPTNVKTMGFIMVNSRPSEGIKLVRKKDRQAQILVTEETRSVNNIQLNFRQKLKTACVETKGCCVTVNSGYIFTDYNDDKLVALNSYGTTEYNIKLTDSYASYNLACIDNNTVAETTGIAEKECVLIIDLTTRKVKRFVELPGTPFGISFDGKSLIYCCSGNYLYMISCLDFSCTNIQNTLMSPDSYIATHGGKIFYTVPYDSKVSCLYNGKLVWEFKNESVLKNPGGIAVDDKGNVFVVGIGSKNIVVISTDGKQYKEIQTKKYGLTNPSTIFFDSIRKQMIVSNDDNFAHIYDISY